MKLISVGSYYSFVAGQDDDFEQKTSAPTVAPTRSPTGRLFISILAFVRHLTSALTAHLYHRPAKEQVTKWTAQEAAQFGSMALMPDSEEKGGGGVVVGGTDDDEKATDGGKIQEIPVSDTDTKVLGAVDLSGSGKR